MRRKISLLIFLAAIGWQCASQKPTAAGSYRLVDFHQHSTFTDGDYSLGEVFRIDDSVGLAWWASSEHGGASARNGLVSGLDKGSQTTWSADQIKGDSSALRMWRWQVIEDYSFPFIVEQRKQYPDRVIVQGLEWNVPGHEHASMAIVDAQFDTLNPSATPIAQFEYIFDGGDVDTSQRRWEKSSATGDDKFQQGLRWLAQNYPTTSWVIVGHPDRAGRWSIADLRNGNNIAPNTFFGFEGIPGHQKSADRGEYGKGRPTYGATTWGGAGYMVARVGGLWDAMLSEGRRWWLFSASDFHNIRADFYPGEYNRTYLYMPSKIEPTHIADYLRSGNSFAVGGDFVDGLNFTIEGAPMGSTLNRTKDEIEITIQVHQPKGALPLDRVDLIEGVVTGYRQVGTPQFSVDTVATTRIIKTFEAPRGGEMAIKYKLTPSAPHTYYRIRGTHTGSRRDGDGNPLPDNGVNSPQIALADQWFYSNPIFVRHAAQAIEVVTHRGANNLAPENTIASSLKAIEHGAKWLEVDVRTSSDGVMYNFHDATADRTTDGSGRLSQMTAAQIEALDAGSWFSTDFAGEKVPRIEEMIELARDKNVNLYFDVKSADVEKLVALVNEAQMGDRAFFWFGSNEMLSDFLKIAPQMRVKVNASNVGDIQKWQQILNPAIIEISPSKITPQVVEYCRQYGIKIMSMGKNSEEDYRLAIESGADMINLDQPELFEKVAGK